MMSKIVSEAETLMFTDVNASTPWTVGHQARTKGHHPTVARAGRVQPITESVVEAASHISRRLNAALLMVATHSGRTALALSKQRNPALTIALAHDPETARAMALYWGVTPLPMPEYSSRDQLRAFMLEWCRTRGLIAPGDRIVGIRGSLPDDPTHNEIVVLEVP
jgi:pyruvate kinase